MGPDLVTDLGGQPQILHGPDGGRCGLEIRKLGHRAQCGTGTLDADVLQIENKVEVPGFCQAHTVYEVGPIVEVSIKIADILDRLVPVQSKAHHGIVDTSIRFRYHADPDHMRNPLKQEVAVPPVIDKVTFAGPFAYRFRNKSQIAGLVPGKAFPRRKPFENGDLEPADGDTRLR